MMVERDGDLVAVLAGWSAGRGALYRRLADAFRTAILNDALADGTRLPPERVLAERLGISRSTVVAAFDLLEADDLIVRQQGSGTRVRVRSGRPDRRRLDRIEPAGPRLPTAGSRNAFFRRMTDSADQTIDLVGAYLLSDEGLPAYLLADLVPGLSALSRTHGYFPLGHPELRRAIAEHLTRRGLPTVQDEIIVTTGAQQAIHLAAGLVVDRGDAVVVENPTYPGALDAFAARGARLTWVRTGPGGADVDALADLVARGAPRLAYLIPTYQNPVGGVLSEPRRRGVARLVEDSSVVLIDDQCLSSLGLDDEEPPPPIATFAPDAPILTIDSVSKLGWGGLRVGWIRAPEEIVARLGSVKAVADLGSSLPAQLIAAHILREFDALRLDRRAHLRARFDLVTRTLRRTLPSWSWDTPRGGLCLWVRLPYGSASEFVEVAARYGVAIVSGTVASADGGFGDYLRLPFGQEPATLDEGLHRLAAAWAAYEPRAPARSQRLSIIV